MVLFKFTAGDVFAISLGENKFVYGQAVLTTGLETIIIFDGLKGADPDLNEIIKSKIDFFAITVGIQIENVEWALVGNTEIPKGIHFPEFKVDTLDGYFVTDFTG
nr:Imm26 family immunity protein [Paenibacillus shirakamiensis]